MGDDVKNVQHKNVFVALCAAQAAMEKLVKGAVNPAFKGEGKPKGTAYADLADVVEAVRSALNAQGLAYFHQFIPAADGAPHIMRTSLVHGETDTRIDCDVPLIVAKNDMQGMKSATTYAKRIGLESVTGVAPEDDDGNAAAAAPPQERQNGARGGQSSQKPAMPSREAVDAATGALMNADTVDRLNAIWLELPKDVRDVTSVKGAGAARKAELTSNADLGGDHIPYEGK